MKIRDDSAYLANCRADLWN